MLDKSEYMNLNNGAWASGTPDMGHAPVLSPHSSFYIDGYNLYFSLLEFCQDWTIVNGRKHKQNGLILGIYNRVKLYIITVRIKKIFDK